MKKPINTNYNSLINQNSRRFIIPIGNISIEESQRQLAELTSRYSQTIDIPYQDNQNINIPYQSSYTLTHSTDRAYLIPLNIRYTSTSRKKNFFQRFINLLKYRSIK